MVQEIDFLPLPWRQARIRGRTARLRRIALGVFLSVMVLGAVQQRRNLSELGKVRSRLQERSARMAAQIEPADQLRARVDELDAEAGVVTILRSRASVTALLASAANSLPEGVVLTDLRLSVEAVRPPVESQPQSRPKTVPKAAPKVEKKPLIADLERLRAQQAESAVVLTLIGNAPDTVAISQYLAALEKTGSFDEIRLLYSAEVRERKRAMRAFEARLVVRRPGRPASMSKKPAAAPAAVAGTSGGRAP